MGSDRAQRPVTRAQRDFGPAQLAQLNRDDTRKLCHALLISEGAAIEDFRMQLDFDEFTVSVSGLWHERRIIVRIYQRGITQSDLEDASSYIATIGADEALILPTAQSVTFDAIPGVTVLPPEVTADRITGSPLAHWTMGRPAVSLDRLELALSLANTAILDPVGIQWLPSLALNELPSALIESDVEPQDLLERKTFRLLTSVFRFGGVRYGEAARGSALPDSVLHWPDGSGTAALVDAKAASSGYTMTSDHLLRFENYWKTLAPEVSDGGFELRYLVIVSSYFPSADPARHPFLSRRDQLRERTGLDLAYVMASDLAWIAAQVEAAEVPLAEREHADWNSILVQGLVTSDHLGAEFLGVRS